MTAIMEDIMNTSVVNTSAIQDDDFHMLLDCLEELKISTVKRKSKRWTRQKNAIRRFQSQPQIFESLPNEIQNPNQTIIGNFCEENANDSSFSSMNTSCVSFNDTCTSVNNDQLNKIFAYFDQDVKTDELLCSDDESKDESQFSDKENIAHVANKLHASSECNVLKVTKPQIDKEEIRNKSNDILNTIKHVHEAEQHDKNVELRQFEDEKKIDRISTYSGSSTLTLHDSDSETVFKKPFDKLENCNVKQKVAFFNDHSSSERSSSASPSVQSVSDDDDFKHKFKVNRDFFEHFFKGKQNKGKKTHKLNNVIDTNKQQSRNEMKSSFCKQKPIVSHDIDVNEKLKAVQTYVQTQYLLERIQRLVTAISNLDEKRLSSMNLKSLKKFLTFILDCSHKCNEVCYDISEHFLNDFEKNVMSAEDLLFSALKMAHSQQVYNAKLKTQKIR